MQPGNRLVVITEVFQYCFSVLSALWRCRAEARWRAAQRDCLANQLDSAELRVLDGLCDSDVLDLRVRENLIHLVDGAAGESCLIQDLDPLGRSPGPCDLGDDRIQLRAVLAARAASCKIGIGREMLGADGAAESAVNIPPALAMLTCPSRVGNTPVGMVVG